MLCKNLPKKVGFGGSWGGCMRTYRTWPTNIHISSVMIEVCLPPPPKKNLPPSKCLRCALSHSLSFWLVTSQSIDLDLDIGHLETSGNFVAYEKSFKIIYRPRFLLWRDFISLWCLLPISHVIVFSSELIKAFLCVWCILKWTHHSLFVCLVLHVY